MATALTKHEEAAIAVLPISPEALIAKAIETGLPVEGLERLMNLRERLKAENAKAEYDAAMSAFQAECPVIQKKKQADRYKYAPIEDIVEQTKELRAKLGFSHSFDSGFVTDEGGPAQVIYCRVTHIGGHSEVSTFRSPIDVENRARMSSPQQSGAAMTFGKRYAFCNAFGIVTADEDSDARRAKQEDGPAPATASAQAASGPSCPGCGKAEFVRKGSNRSSGDPEWYCYRKLGGCGKTWPVNAKTIAAVEPEEDRPIDGDWFGTLSTEPPRGR